MKRHAATLPLLLGLSLFAGCSTPGPHQAQEAHRYTLENTARFVLMDQATQHSVTCTGLQERMLSDGRLEVTANVKNRESRRIQVQIQCVFKDSNSTPTGDETPWKDLILTENSTEAVGFTAMNTKASKYTIKVRQAR